MEITTVTRGAAGAAATTRALPASAPHGSVSGFIAGCTSNGGCPNHQSPRLFTCAEATVAHRADYRLARLPLAEPLPRDRATAAPTSEPGPTAPTLAAAPPRESVARASMSRRSAPGTRRTARVHGTTTGYLRGCRSRDSCPRDASGVSCSEARNAQRRALARSRGVAARPETVDCALAERAIAAWRAQGASLRAIARMTGVGHTTITKIATRTVDAVRPETVERILSANSRQG